MSRLYLDQSRAQGAVSKLYGYRWGHEHGRAVWQAWPKGTPPWWPFSLAKGHTTMVALRPGRIEGVPFSEAQEVIQATYWPPDRGGSGT